MFKCLFCQEEIKDEQSYFLEAPNKEQNRICLECWEACLTWITSGEAEKFLTRKIEEKNEALSLTAFAISPSVIPESLQNITSAEMQKSYYRTVCFIEKLDKKEAVI